MERVLVGNFKKKVWKICYWCRGSGTEECLIEEYKNKNAKKRCHICHGRGTI